MLKDGNLSFEGGQDAGRSPSIINRNQVAAATNASMRNGFLQPRSAFIKRTLNFSNDTVSAAFRQGRFQHGAFFDGSQAPMLLSSHGGRLFKIDLLTLNTTEITPLIYRNTTVTADFVAPAVGSDVTISVADTFKMVPSSASGLTVDQVPLTIAGVAYTLKHVNGPISITVTTLSAAVVGTTIASGAAVKFQYLDTNSERQQIGWSVQAENYWIYQDNQSLPIIFNGAVARRAVPGQQEVPVGNVMGYGSGRLVVALPDRTSFRVGDIVFGASGTPANGYRDAILKFTENSYLNEGGDFVARVFGAPSGYGPITCIKPLSMMDTQLGQGPIMVGTPYIIFTLNLPFDRTTWKDLANPLQTVTPIIGPAGQNSTVNINTDMWYRSNDDGIHSFVLARRDFASWGNTPQSTELGETLSHDSAWMLEFGSSVFFDNRLLMTCSPVQSASGVWHRGLVALDFNLLSSLRGRTSPAWEGIWSGLRVLQMVTGTINNVPRCFIYALNDSNEIEIWEMDSEATMDNNAVPIRWTSTTPSYNHGDGFNLKRLETGELFVDDVRGQVDITAQYRSDQNPCWRDWDSFSFCAKNTDCGPFDCTGPQSYREQFRSKLKLHAPTDEFDEINGRKYRTGYEFQAKLEVVGHCRIKQLRVLAIPEPESANAERSMPATI